MTKVYGIRRTGGGPSRSHRSLARADHCSLPMWRGGGARADSVTIAPEGRRAEEWQLLIGDFERGGLGGLEDRLAIRSAVATSILPSCPPARCLSVNFTTGEADEDLSWWKRAVDSSCRPSRFEWEPNRYPLGPRRSLRRKRFSIQSEKEPALTSSAAVIELSVSESDSYCSSPCSCHCLRIPANVSTVPIEDEPSRRMWV